MIVARKHRFVSGAALIAVSALVLSGCGGESADNGSDSNSASGGSGDMLTFKIGVHPCASDCGFLQMAEEKGFFEKYGVDVEYVELQSASQALPALAAGEVDAIEESPGGFFVASEQGNLDATIIGSTMDGLPYAIYAKSKYDDLSDLKGKSMAISSPTGLPAIVANLMLEEAGVDTASVTQLNAGGNADRYRAVVAGTADAASSPADYVPQAEADGVKVLGLSADVIPDYPRYMVIARNDSLKGDGGEAATRYLAGMMEGIRYAYAHPDEAKAIAAKALKTTADDPMITYMNDLIADKQLCDPDAGVMQDKLDFQEKALMDQGQLKDHVDMDALVDDSYQQAALKLVK
jgi:NitT/TauT family transport system substrate-binding protein